MHLHKKWLYAWVGLSLLVSVSCAAPLALVRASEEGLQGTQWQLDSFGPDGSEITVMNGTQVTLAFTSEHQAGGTDGCNTFEADYQSGGDTLQFRNVSSSRISCANESFMHQEAEYLKALEKAGHYDIEDDRLTIWCDNGHYRLNFIRSLSPGLVGAVIAKG